MQITTQIQNLPNHLKYLEFKNHIRFFFKTKKFTEVELPTLSPALIPESSIEVFKTQFKYESELQNLHLTPSPELFLKRLLVEGIGDCYSLGRSYRNYELQGSLHGLEFDMLEFYQVDADYMDLADTLLHLLQYLDEMTYSKTKIDLSSWHKISVAEAFSQYAGITEIFDNQEFMSQAEAKGYEVQGFDYTEVFSQVMTNEVEPKLGRGQASLLYDYPIDFASLAKANKDRKTAQRFEFYINGVEMGNAFSELLDADEQSKRFDEEVEYKKRYKMQDVAPDTGFIDALNKGLPECSGIAVGVERLAMFFYDLDNIGDMRLVEIS